MNLSSDTGLKLALPIQRMLKNCSSLSAYNARPALWVNAINGHPLG